MPFTLHPYRRGDDRGYSLYEAWRRLDAQDCVRPMLWSTGEPRDIRGDFPGFAQFATAPGRAVTFFGTDEGDLAGMIWYDDITPTSLTLSICLLPDARGTEGVSAARAFMAELFERSGVQRMVAYTPWRAAKFFASSCGFKLVATIPGQVRLDDQAYDLYVLHCDRSSFNER